MICDICNAEVNESEGLILPNKEAKELFNSGFGIDEANIEMLTSTGMPRDVAIKSLKEFNLQYNSDWLLCPKCVSDLKEFKEQTGREKF